jgi:pyruvate ferredoxin oxidoreductase gamma subunit
MYGVTEVRFHGRGGQGAKTAAQMLAEAVIAQGKYVQAFPEYGPERSGAPMRSYTRLSDNPITIHSGVYHPDIVAVLDNTLLESVDVLEGISSGGTILINTPDSAESIKSKLKADDVKIYTVDATKIAMETTGKPFPNTPMLGALAKATGIIGKEGLIKEIKHKFLVKLGEKLTEANVQALNRAYEEVKGTNG